MYALRQTPPATSSYSIMSSDIAQYGHTAGCKGCAALRLEEPPQGHTEACHAQRSRAMSRLWGTTSSKTTHAYREERQHQGPPLVVAVNSFLLG